MNSAVTTHTGTTEPVAPDLSRGVDAQALAALLHTQIRGQVHFDEHRGGKKEGLFLPDIVRLPPGGGRFLVEFGSETLQESVDQAHRLVEELKKVEK